MELLLLINGLIFCYLLFTGNLSDKKGIKDKKAAYIGFGIFLILAIISTILFYEGNFRILKLLGWIAAVITSVALLVKVYYLPPFSKKDNYNVPVSICSMKDAGT